MGLILGLRAKSQNGRVPSKKYLVPRALELAGRLDYSHL